MQVSELRIRNYRGVKDTTLSLGEVNILIGENNSGKTSIIEALRTCLSEKFLYGKRVFTNFDYHLESENASPTKADPIEISLKVQERHKGEWSKNTSDAFGEVVQDSAAGLKYIFFASHKPI